MAIRVTRTGVALVVGIIILALATAASLYFVKHAGEQARRDEAIKIAEERLKSEADDKVAVGGNESGSGSAQGSDKTTGSNSGANSDSNSADGSGSGGGSGGSSADSSAGELPQTGPSPVAVVLSAVLAGGVTYATVLLVPVARLRLLGHSGASRQP